MDRKKTEYELRRLTMEDIEEVKELFSSVFTKEPWYDDWSDKRQLHSYMTTLLDNPNALSLGLFFEGRMMGLSLGFIKYWYSGTEYSIEELCISSEFQGHGTGSALLSEIEGHIKNRGINTIILQTKRSAPAFTFYQKNGFVEQSDSVAMYKHC